MKTRQGFVSNSSSCSYIVTIIGLDIETFNNFVSDIVSKEDVVAAITKRIEDIKKSISEDEESAKKDDNTFLGVHFIELRKESLAYLEKMKNDILACADGEKDKLSSLFLDYFNIDVEDKGRALKLTNHVTMHNSYEDMNAIMKEIVLTFLFDTKYIVMCERREDF